MNTPKNIIPHEHQITRELREQRFGNKGLVIWFTGLSGSGKSTLAGALEQALFEKHIRTYLLDGDNIRGGLNADLNFSKKDREENIRRVGEVARLFSDAGVVVLTAFISPFIKDRQRVRELCPDRFVEVFVDCPLEICEQRDVKGLYKKARAGEIPDFTGISSPFEAPESPEITVHSGKDSLEKCLDDLMKAVTPKLTV